MSLWYESLGHCIYDSGADREARAECILSHLSMPVPRLWWERSLQEGVVSESYIDILHNLFNELQAVPALAGRIEFSLLVALSFVDEPGNLSSEPAPFSRSIEGYLSRALVALSKHPEINRLSNAIKKRSPQLEPAPL